FSVGMTIWPKQFCKPSIFTFFSIASLIDSSRPDWTLTTYHCRLLGGGGSSGVSAATGGGSGGGAAGGALGAGWSGIAFSVVMGVLSKRHHLAVSCCCCCFSRGS